MSRCFAVYLVYSSLRGNLAGDKGKIGDEGAKALGNALAKNASLEVLG